MTKFTFVKYKTCSRVLDSFSVFESDTLVSHIRGYCNSLIELTSFILYFPWLFPNLSPGRLYRTTCLGVSHSDHHFSWNSAVLMSDIANVRKKLRESLNTLTQIWWRRWRPGDVRCQRRPFCVEPHWGVHWGYISGKGEGRVWGAKLYAVRPRNLAMANSTLSHYP